MKKTLSLSCLFVMTMVLLSSCNLFNKESDEKQIKSFAITTPFTEGVINESAKTIVVDLPEGTDVTNLVPSIVVSDLATVNPASGTAQDFTNPVTYTVTAENGSTATYVVTVTVGGQGGGGGATDPQHMSGTINENATWKDLGLPIDYIIDDYMYIDGNAALTIEPGVTIMFSSNNCGLEFGKNTGVKMVGTADKPIVFCGPTNNPNNGSWHSIRVNSVRNDNEMEYVQFLRGGSEDYNYWSGVVLINGKLSMKHCLIDGGLKNGVAVINDGYLSAYEDNTIKNIAEYPLFIENPTTGFKNISANNTYVDNGKNYINLASDNFNCEANVTFAKQPIPYYFPFGFEANSNKTFTIEAGAKFLFEYDKYFIVHSDVDLHINGTEAQPVVMQGLRHEAGQWRGLEYRSSRATSEIKYLTISDCGLEDSWYNSNCMFIDDDARLTIDHVTFSNSNYYGLWIEDISKLDRITYSNLTFSNIKKGNIYLEYEGDYNEQHYDGGSTLEQLP